MRFGWVGGLVGQEDSAVALTTLTRQSTDTVTVGSPEISSKRKFPFLSTYNDVRQFTKSLQFPMFLIGVVTFLP
jgi:hypothetical protein